LAPSPVTVGRAAAHGVATSPVCSSRNTVRSPRPLPVSGSTPKLSRTPERIRNFSSGRSVTDEHVRYLPRHCNPAGVVTPRLRWIRIFVGPTVHGVPSPDGDMQPRRRGQNHLYFVGSARRQCAPTTGQHPLKGSSRSVSHSGTTVHGPRRPGRQAKLPDQFA
jgi:hypothetical protein